MNYPVVIKPHADDCVAMDQVRRGRWKSPWCYIPDSSDSGWNKSRRYRGGKTGRPHKRSWRIWFEIECNDPNCDGLIRVSEHWLLEQLPHG